jgi:p-hydroxybenzoate 3-monooxygenase
VQAPLALILKTQVAIIGGGPSGLLLGQLLLRQGIDTVILERRTRAHVLSRIRAGVLERGLVDLLREAGVADRLEREGIRHDGTLLSFDDEMFRVDFTQATGHAVTVYGQTEVTRDLYAAREAAGAPILSTRPRMWRSTMLTDRRAIHHLQHRGAPQRLDCDFVAGATDFTGSAARPCPKVSVQEYSKRSIPSAGSASCPKHRPSTKS